MPRDCTTSATATSPSPNIRTVKQVNGEWEAVEDLTWTASPHIRTGGASNLLQVICIWDAISLYVNGWHLVTVYDDAFDGGEVGLTVGTSDDPGSA